MKPACQSCACWLTDVEGFSKSVFCDGVLIFFLARLIWHIKSRQRPSDGADLRSELLAQTLHTLAAGLSSPATIAILDKWYLVDEMRQALFVDLLPYLCR